MTLAAPFARFGAMWTARVASESAAAELHHRRGQDRGAAKILGPTDPFQASGASFE